MRIVYRPGYSIWINRPASRRVNLTTQKALPKCQQTNKHTNTLWVRLSSAPRSSWARAWVFLKRSKQLTDFYQLRMCILPYSMWQAYPCIMIISRLATIRTSKVGATRASRRSNKNLKFTPDRPRILKKEVKKQGWPGEVHQGGEGPHWTVVPSKKKA